MIRRGAGSAAARQVAQSEGDALKKSPDPPSPLGGSGRFLDAALFIVCAPHDALCTLAMPGAVP